MILRKMRIGTRLALGFGAILAIMLVVGTIPTGIIGFLLQDPLKSLFGDPRAASVFLIVNGGILFAAEMFRRRDERRRRVDSAPILAHEEDDPAYQGVDGLSLRTALIVGLFQVGALLPGISRSGANNIRIEPDRPSVDAGSLSSAC